MRKEDEAKEYVRSKEGELVGVAGVQPSEGKPTEEPKEKTKPPHEPTQYPGPGSFVPDSEGYIERVIRRGIPFARPQPARFPPHEMHLVSKLEYLIGKPIILFNEEHDEYLFRKEAKDDSFVRFIIDVMSKEMAFYNVKKDEEENKLIEDKSELVIRTLRKAEEMKYRSLRRLGIK